MSSAADILYGSFSVSRPEPVRRYKTNRYYCDRLHNRIYVARASDTIAWCEAQIKPPLFERVPRQFALNTSYFKRYAKFPNTECGWLCTGTNLYGLTDDEQEGLWAGAEDAKRDGNEGSVSDYFTYSARALEKLVRKPSALWEAWTNE